MYDKTNDHVWNLNSTSCPHSDTRIRNFCSKASLFLSNEFKQIFHSPCFLSPLDQPMHFLHLFTNYCCATITIPCCQVHEHESLCQQHIYNAQSCKYYVKRTKKCDVLSIVMKMPKIAHSHSFYYGNFSVWELRYSSAHRNCFTRGKWCKYMIQFMSNLFALNCCLCNILYIWHL